MMSSNSSDNNNNAVVDEHDNGDKLLRKVMAEAMATINNAASTTTSVLPNTATNTNSYVDDDDTTAAAVAATPTTNDDLFKMTVKELQNESKKRAIPYSGLRKVALVETLQSSMNSSTAHIGATDPGSSVVVGVVAADTIIADVDAANTDADTDSSQQLSSSSTKKDGNQKEDDEEKQKQKAEIIIIKKPQQQDIAVAAAAAAAAVPDDDDDSHTIANTACTTSVKANANANAAVILSSAAPAAAIDDDDDNNNSIATPISSSSNNNNQEELKLTKKQKEVIESQQKELQRHQDTLKGMHNVATNNIHILEEEKKQKKKKQTNATATATATANAAATTVAVAADINNYHVPKELRSHCSESKSNYWSLQLDQDDDLLLQRSSPSKQPATRTTRKSRRSSLVLPHSTTSTTTNTTTTSTNTNTNTTTTAQLKRKSTEDSVGVTVADTSSATIAAATTTTTTTVVVQLVDDTSEKKDDINSITYNSKDAECKFCGGFYSKGAGLVAHEKRFCRSNPLSWSSYQRFLSSSQATTTAAATTTENTASTTDNSPTTNESTDVDAAEVGINSNNNSNKVECEFCGKFFSEGIGIGVHQTRSFYCSLKNPNKKTNIDETTSDDIDDGSDTITIRDGRPRRLPIDNDVKEKKKRYTLTALVVPPPSSISTSTRPYEIGVCTKKYSKECRAWYKGEITEYNSTTYLYKVHYDDGDQEELSHHEINTEPFPSKPMYEMNMQFERYLLNKSTEVNTMPGTIATKFYYIPPPQSTINWPRWRYRVEYFDGDSEDLDEFEITASIKSSQHKRGPKKKAGGVLSSSPSKEGRAHDDESNDGKKKPVEDSVGTVTGTSSATIAAATTTTTIPTTTVKQFVVDTSKEKKDINNTTFSSKYTKCKLCGGFYFKEAAHEPFCRHAIKSAKKALHAMKCAKKALHAIKSAKEAAVAKTTTELYNSVTNNMKMLTQKQKKKESTEEHALAHLSPSSFTPSTSFTSSTGVQISLPQPLTSNPNTESATTDAYAGKFDPSLSSSSTRKKSSLSSPPNMSVNKKTSSSSSSSLTATSGTPCEPVYKFGTRIKRYFNNQSSWYVGTIRSFDPKTQLYSIEYDHHDDDGSDHHELLELNNDDLHITSRRIGLLPKSNSPLYDIGFQFQKFVQSSPNHSKSAGMIMVGTIKYITICNEINLHRYEWLYRVVYRTKHLGDISFDLSESDITNSITDQQQQQQLEVNNNNNNNNMQRQLKNNTPRMTADGIAVTAVEAAANAVAAAAAFTEHVRKLEHMQRLNKNNAVVDSRPMVATATHIPAPAPADDVLVPATEATPTPVPVSATETTPVPVTALVTAAVAATATGPTATDPTAAAAAKLATAAIPDVNTDMKILAAATANDVDPIIKKITFAPTHNGTTTTTASKKTVAVTTKKNKLDAGGQDVNNKRRKIQEYVLHDNSSRPVKNTHDKHELEPQQPRQPIPPDGHDFYYGQQQQEHPYMSLYAPVQMFDASSSASLGGEAGGVEECHDDSDTVMNTKTDMAEIAGGSETMPMSNNSDDKDYEEREERFRAILNGEEISIDDIEAEDHGVYHIVGEDGEFETVVEFYDQYHHPQNSSPSPEESASVEEDDGSKSSRPTTPPLPSTIAYAGEAEAGVVDLYHHNYPALLQQQHQFEVENAHYGEGNNNGNDADVMMRSPLTKALLACRNKVAHPTAKLKSTKAKIHKAATTTKMKSSSKNREEKLALIAQQQGKLLSVLQAKKRKGSTNTAGAVHKKKKSKMKKDADAGKLPKNTNQSFAVDVKVATGVGGVSSIDGAANTTPKSKKDKRVKPESKLVEENWYLSYAILVDFYNLNGNSSVLRSDPNKKLSGWVKRQRNNRREGKLCQKKIDELDKLHFVWHRLDHAWDTKYNMLIQYQNKHGNCEIGTNVNRPLAEWTQRQRREYRNRHNFVRQHNIDMTNIQTRNDFDLNKRGSMMTSDRIDALEKIPDWFWEKKEVAKTGVMET